MEGGRLEKTKKRLQDDLDHAGEEGKMCSYIWVGPERSTTSNSYN